MSFSLFCLIAEGSAGKQNLMHEKYLLELISRMDRNRNERGKTRLFAKAPNVRLRFAHLSLSMRTSCQLLMSIHPLS